MSELNKKDCSSEERHLDVNIGNSLFRCENFSIVKQEADVVVISPTQLRWFSTNP